MTLKINLFRGVPLVMTLFLASCDSDVDELITITGTVRYLETNATAKLLPIKLSIYDLDKPFDRSNPNKNRVLTDEVNTNNDGTYTFVINRSSLPNNTSYSLTVDVDSLLVANEITPCFGQSFAGGDISTNNKIVRDILVDYPTYLQLTVDKVDHSTNDRVRFYRPSCSLAVHEITIENPDTTVLETMPFYYFKKVDIHYFILKENEETIEFKLTDIELIKNDTTKLKIEY